MRRPLLAIVLVAGTAATTLAQGPAQVAPAPPPVVSQPLSPPAAPSPAAPEAPQPAAPATQAAPAAPAAPPATESPPAQAAPAAPPVTVPAPPPVREAQPAADRDAVLAGKPGDPSSVDVLTLTSKPAIAIIGQTTWDKATDTLQGIFARLEREAGTRGLAIAGRPLTVFLETDDIGFRYEAMLPVARTPEGLTTPGEIRAAQTPSGRAMRFVHKAPYEDIEATYEGITAYLDAKGVIVRDQFVEEYVSPLSEAGDIGFEANIYVLPR